MKADNAEEFEYGPAKPSELSAIVGMEHKCFPGYPYAFSMATIRRWYKHNPKMFKVVRYRHSRVVGYSTIVPVSRCLFERITHNAISSLDCFPKSDVLQDDETDCFHIEVFAVAPAAPRGAGLLLLQSVVSFLRDNAKYVSASPITRVGNRLCRHFGFTQVGTEKAGSKEYPIYALTVDRAKIEKLLELLG